MWEKVKPDKMGTPKYINWIDYAKAICIILVYFIHCCNYFGIKTPEIGALITPIYVNAFFFLSGYLMFEKQLSEKVISSSLSYFIKNDGKKTIINIMFKIMLPSIIFSFIEFFPSIILKGRSFKLIDLLAKTIGGGTFWFTSALAIAELLILLLLLTRIRSIWFYVLSSAFLFLVGIVLDKTGFYVLQGYDFFPWHYKQALLATLLLSLGGLFNHLENNYKWHISISMLCILIAIYSVVSLFGVNNIKTSIAACNVNLIGVIISILGIIILIEVCKKIRTSRLLSYIGKHSLGFYFFSGSVPAVYSVIFRRLNIEINYGIFIILFIISLITSTFTVYILNRFVPFVFDFRCLSSCVIFRFKKKK